MNLLTSKLRCRKNGKKGKKIFDGFSFLDISFFAKKYILFLEVRNPFF